MDQNPKKVKTVEDVILVATYQRHQAENHILRERAAELREQVAKQNQTIETQKCQLRSVRGKWNAAEKRKAPENFVYDVALVEGLTGLKATQQIRAYKDFAEDRELEVDGLDFSIGRKVPEQRKRLCAIVERLGKHVNQAGLNSTAELLD